MLIFGALTGAGVAERKAKSSESGLVSMGRKRKEEVAKRPNISNLRPLSQRLKDYFAARGISEATLERNCVRETPQGDIAFLYFRDGEVINIKYRSLDKRFWQAGLLERMYCRSCNGSHFTDTGKPYTHLHQTMLIVSMEWVSRQTLGVRLQEGR